MDLRCFLCSGKAVRLLGEEGKIQRVKGRGGKSRETEREADIVEHCSVLRIDEDIS